MPLLDRLLIRTIARRLGVSCETAAALAAGARARVGRRSYALRSLAFAVALGAPAAMLPARLRRRALLGLVGPLLEKPSALNAYGAGRDGVLREPCGGLWRHAPGARE